MKLPSLDTLTRTRVFVIVVVIWAGIYLPSLGVPEFRGEEGRRVLPAVTMMKTGNWIVPHVGGEPYYNKPPGINWLVAASFLLTGEQSEFSARLVSVVFILGFVSLLVWRNSPWLDLRGRLLAAIVFMTNISLLEKGRYIEIETVYICLAGAALFWWLSGFAKGKSVWSMWLVPGVLLGYGMLVKGPVILLFFYVPVLCVCLYTRHWRSLLSIPHAIGVVLILGMLGAWVWLVSLQIPLADMWKQVQGQVGGRVAGSFRLQYWATNVGKAFINFLPWLLFVPALWDRRLIDRLPQEHIRLYKGARMGLVLSFVLINLMPQVLPRYSLPVFGLASILLGWAISLHPDGLFRSDRVWKGILLFAYVVVCVMGAAGLVRLEISVVTIVLVAVTLAATFWLFLNHRKLTTVTHLAVGMSALVVLVMLQYATFGMHLVKTDDIHRPVAAEINETVPVDETIYAYQPGFQTYLFYVREPLDYVIQPEAISSQMNYLIISEFDLMEEDFRRAIAPRHVRVLYEFHSRHPNGTNTLPTRLVQLSGD